MSFWSRGRQRKDEEDEGAAASPVAAPATVRMAIVEFWGATQRTIAGVDLGHDRLTDQLNRDDLLPVVLLDEVPEDRALPLEKRPGQGWTQLLVADALLVLPPPQATDPQRRLHRPKQPVEIMIGPFIVSGMVHTPPGAQAAGFLMRQNPRFAPVTRAAIRDTGLDGFEQHADVVLVNMRLIDKIQDVGLDQPEPLPAQGIPVPPLA